MGEGNPVGCCGLAFNNNLKTFAVNGINGNHYEVPVVFGEAILKIVDCVQIVAGSHSHI